MPDKNLSEFNEKPDMSKVFTYEEKEIARIQPESQWTEEMKAKLKASETKQPYEPSELAIPKATKTSGGVIRGDEKERMELMEPPVPHYVPGTLADYALIDRFKLVKGIDYYVIGDKAIFQKEGLLKLVPLVRVDGYGISHEVREMIDDPQYKRVTIRAWIGAKDDPIRIAEATCDWRSDLNEASVILLALKNKRIEPTEVLMVEGRFTLDWLKHPNLIQDLLRNNIFALRITEGKALRRAWSELIGVTTIQEQEIKSMTDEVKMIQTKEKEGRTLA